MAASGHFMDPNRPSSLGIEDRSRFRPQSYVAPRNIELMQGTFNVRGMHDDPAPGSRSQHGWFMSN